MKEIREKNKIYFQNLGGKSKPSDSLKQNKKDIESEEDDDNTIIRKTLRTGTLKLGDQFYSLEMIEKMVSLAKEKGNLKLVPNIAMSLYEAIIESKKQKK